MADDIEIRISNHAATGHSFYKVHSIQETDAYSMDSENLKKNARSIETSLENFTITDYHLYPPTMIYMPHPELLTFMINRAAIAEKDLNGKYGFIFWPMNL